MVKEDESPTAVGRAPDPRELNQTTSLVCRSHHRWGRMIVPKAAIAQIIARSPKLAMRKNPPFRSCIERGTI